MHYLCRTERRRRRDETLPQNIVFVPCRGNRYAVSCGCADTFVRKTLLAFFNRDPEVVETGYIRLMMVMLSHTFSLFYEVMAGYLRGFGISTLPAVLTIAGVCGVRIAWIELVFPKYLTFRSIMTAYPISLSATALMILTALLICHPAARGSKANKEQ